MNIYIENISLETDFTKLDHAQLIQIRSTWDPKSQVYLKAIDELSCRQTVKEQEQEEYRLKSDKTQRDIKIIAVITLAAAIITLCFTVAQFYKTVESPAKPKPVSEPNKP